MVLIPKIIHHIAPNDRTKWFPLWTPCYESWLKEFPEHEHMMWDDPDLLDFVSNNYPQFLNFYNKLPFNILRYDVARMLLLHHYGGIYADMDVYCYKNFEEFIDKDFKIVDVSFISQKHSLYDEPHGIEMYLICSQHNNSFLTDCVEYMESNFKEFEGKVTKENLSFLEGVITGPYVVQRMFKKIYDNSHILPPKLFSNHEKFYSKEIYVRHLSCVVWNGWTDLSEEDKKIAVLESYEWMNSKDFSFYKNYFPTLSWD